MQPGTLPVFKMSRVTAYEEYEGAQYKHQTADVLTASFLSCLLGF